MPDTVFDNEMAQKLRDAFINQGERIEYNSFEKRETRIISSEVELSKALVAEITKLRGMISCLVTKLGGEVTITNAALKVPIDIIISKDFADSLTLTCEMNGIKPQSVLIKKSDVLKEDCIHDFVVICKNCSGTVEL